MKSTFACLCFVLLSILLGGELFCQESAVDAAVAELQIEKYKPTIDETVIENFNFQRYFTKDKFDRRITYYYSTLGDSDAQLPLVVCIQGSGSQSLFLERETGSGKSIVSDGPEAVVCGLFAGKVRVLVVEKPGIKFLEQPERPGSALDAPEEYNREFSLDRWTEALNAALEATLTLSNIDKTKVLALGHSEGGQVACELAATNDRVTHVAVMAGGGANQLFDFIEFARSGDMYDPAATPGERVAALMADWKKVMDEPMATNKFILGHSHLRWSSFASSSPVEAILKSQANVFIAQGTEDTSTLPASSDVLFAELLARGRKCTYERVDGGNHAFMTKDDKSGKGWMETMQKAVDWFLK